MAKRLAAGVLTLIVLVVAVVAAVKHSQQRPKAYALFFRIDYDKGHDEWQWMAVTESDCQAIASKVIKELSGPGIHVAFDCVPESDRRVGSAWRTTERRIGRHNRGQVYFYGPNTEPDGEGAYMFETPGPTYADPAKVESIFADKDSCQRMLDLNKSSWKSASEVKDSPEFQKPKYEQMFKEDERIAEGVCTPVRNIAKAKSDLCDGLPLDDAGSGWGGRIYMQRLCARTALKHPKTLTGLGLARRARPLPRSAP